MFKGNKLRKRSGSHIIEVFRICQSLYSSKFMQWMGTTSSTAFYGIIVILSPLTLQSLKMRYRLFRPFITRYTSGKIHSPQSVQRYDINLNVRTTKILRHTGNPPTEGWKAGWPMPVARAPGPLPVAGLQVAGRQTGHSVGPTIEHTDTNCQCTKNQGRSSIPLWVPLAVASSKHTSSTVSVLLLHASVVTSS